MSKGEVGEQLTSEQLSIGLDESLYHYYHNIIVPFKNGSSQIDHLVVSPFGLFIVETKNLAGWIYGASDKAKWTQVLYKTKHQFQNPLRQTFRQKKVLASYFGVQEKNIHPIINFVGDCTFQTEMPSNVIQSDPAKYIKQFTQEVFTYEELDRIQTIAMRILDVDDLSESKHIQSLNDRYASNSVCPKCAAPLVDRVTKKGPNSGTKFLGCSAYPKCHFSKPHATENASPRNQVGSKRLLFKAILISALAAIVIFFLR